MDRQRYAIGQVVKVALRSLSGPATKDPFRIVRRYPGAFQAPMYHIHSIVGRGQRMVPEDELSVVMPGVFGRPDGPSKVLRLFPEIVRFDRSVTT